MESYICMKLTLTKKAFTWQSDDSATEITCYQHIFKFIKWEDDEAWEIAELLERYEER